MHHILLIEDSPADAALIRAMVEEIDSVSKFTHCQRLQEAAPHLTGEDCCLVLLDLNLPDSEGLATLKGVRAARPQVPVVVLTGLDDQDLALSAIRNGAQDYLVKGETDRQLLERTIGYALERHQLRQELEKSMERMRLAARVMEAALEGIFVTDPDFRIIEINPAFSEITGLRLEEIRGRRPRVLGAGSYEEERYLEIEQTMKKGGFWQGEVWHRRKDGEVYAAWLNVSPLRDERGRDGGHVGVFMDITQRKLVEEHLKKMAHYDVLTGLPNRALFHDRLDQALHRAGRNGGKVGILFLDLDKFKPINDLLGHDTGDLILQELAQRLQGCIRKSDTVARLGGDEFTIILPEIDQPEAAIHLAEKILDAIAEPFFPKNIECRLAASIGLSLYPEHGQDRETLLKKADCAMYQAKEEGNRYYLFGT